MHEYTTPAHLGTATAAAGGDSPAHTYPHLELLFFLLLFFFFFGGGGAHKAPTRGRCMRNVHRRKGRWITRPPSVCIDG